MKKNILITGVGGRSIGSGILHSLLRSNSASKDKWNIHVSDADSFSWGLYMVANAVKAPLATKPDYVEFILDYVQKNNIDAILPGTEIETQVLLENKEKFTCPIIANDLALIPLMMDKFIAEQKMKELGLDFIETVPLKDWKQIKEKFGFPLIVKPTRGTGGSRGLNIVTTEKEMLDIIDSYSDNVAPCVQPYIGTEDDEYTVGILSDKDGALIDSIVLKRKLTGLSLLQSKNFENRTIAISTGYSQGYFIKDEQVSKFCEDLALKLKSKGPLNLQLRKHNGKIYVFEIHTRFSGTTTFRADVGFNEPDILLRNHLFNEKFGRLNYTYNVACIRAFEHVVVPIDKML
ncbi:MAG: ATP-grasp domain-containing protein [Bacteroidia bacterium]